MKSPLHYLAWVKRLGVRILEKKYNQGKRRNCVFIGLAKNQKGLSIITFLIAAIMFALIALFSIQSVQNSVRTMNDLLTQNHQVEVMTSTIRRALTNNRSCQKTLGGKSIASSIDVTDILSVKSDDNSSQKVYAVGDSLYKDSTGGDVGLVKLARINLSGYNAATSTANLTLIFDRKNLFSVQRQIPITVVASGAVVDDCRYGSKVTADSVCKLLGGTIVNGNCVDLNIIGSLTVEKIDKDDSREPDPRINASSLSLNSPGLADVSSDTVVTGNVQTESFTTAALRLNKSSTSAATARNLAVGGTLQLKSGMDLTTPQMTIQKVDGSYASPSFEPINCGANQYLVGLTADGGYACASW